MLFRNKGTTRKLSKLVALTFALNCVTYTATPLANLSISGQNYKNNGQNIHVNVPQMQMFGFGKASATSMFSSPYYIVLANDENINAENSYIFNKDVHDIVASEISCSDGSVVKQDVKFLIDGKNYDKAAKTICWVYNGVEDESDDTPVDTPDNVRTSSTATSTGSSSSPKTTYTSSITYSTGNSNQATVNANLLLDSLGKMANGSSNAGRTYSQEEMDLAYVRAYQNTGVTAQTIEQTKANIEQAEAEAEENGTEVPKAVKAMKAIVEQYNDVVDRVTGGNSILGDNPVTLEQLAVLRTALKTEQIKSDTECQNKRVEDENATCELSAKGKEYASLLAYLEAKQVNQTTGSTRTKNSTDPGTQNTATTVKTTYGNVNGGNSPITNGSGSGSGYNSGSGSSSYVTTASGSTVSCNGGIYIQSDNTCCPSDKPVYKNKKCYASTSEIPSSPSSSKGDGDNFALAMAVASMMNKNGSGNSSGDTSGAMLGTGGDNRNGKGSVAESMGSKIQTKLYPYPKDSIQQMGVAEKLIVGYQADQRLNLRDANGNAITPIVVVTVPTYYKDANGNDRFMEYQVKGEVGKEIVVLPDTSNSMYYKLQGVPGEAYRKMNEKDENGQLIPWLMKIEVFNPKTNEQIGTGFINYYVVSMTTSILNDPKKIEWDVQSVSEAEEVLAKLSHSFAGTIEGTSYDDANGLCILQTKGTVVSNYDSSIYGTEKLEGYTKVATDKVDKKGCESLDGSGKKVMFNDIRAMKDVNGSDATYFTDTDNGKIKIGDGDEDETTSYLKQSSLKEEYRGTAQAIDGSGMIISPRFIRDENGELQIAEEETYNGERRLCKDVPACMEWVENALGIPQGGFKDIKIKTDETTGIPKVHYAGNYIGVGNESGFTKVVTNQIMPTSRVDYINSRIQNSGEIPTGIESVISLNYNQNKNGISIENISRTNGGTLSQNPAEKSSSQALNLAKEIRHGIADAGAQALNMATSIPRAILSSGTKVNFAQSVNSDSVFDPRSWNLADAVKNTYISVNPNSENPEEDSKIAQSANATFQAAGTAIDVASGTVGSEVTKKFGGSDNNTTTTVTQNPDGTTSVRTTGTTNDEDFLARLRELRKEAISGN